MAVRHTLLLLLLLAFGDCQLVRLQKCDPKQFTKKPHPGVNTSYLYCNTDGSLAKRDCPAGKRFNSGLLECEPAPMPALPPDRMHSPPLQEEGGETAPDPAAVIQTPQFQAPDDICTGGSPLTKLGAPVVCNPSISSCPDGYLCTLHQRTGISYCCQAAVDLVQESTLCAGNQVTYFEPLTGLPKTCALSAPSGCPTGFGCNLVGGSFTRCCGRDFGCPANSAGYVHPTTGSHVQCNSADPLSCPNGFICTQSSMFNTGICCSDTSNTPTDVCGGEVPLAQPNPCSASDPCPTGFGCRNGRCCPSKGVCPAGAPLGGVTSCSGKGNPCPNNFQCVTNNGHEYCCPSSEHVCGLPKDPGIPCQARGVPAVSRYYFDAATGTCRSFQFSQCGGNANSFDTLEQCEGFCLESQCPQGGTGLRAGPALATCTPGDSQPGAHDGCPAHYQCTQPRFGATFVCCANPENVCKEPVSAGNACFGAFLTVQRFQYNPEKAQCEPFQYYGCGGTGNNFASKGHCENTCQPSVRSVCNGVAPLNDEGDYVQRCSENVQCPQGSWCNSRGYCCPHQETACTSPRSIGHTCLSQKPGTFWYFDPASAACLPFTYSGCGGTPNRFAEREACEQMCARGEGECPRGMTPFLTSAGTKRCHPSQSRACPEGSSCVQSSQGEWLCCSSTAQCPQGRSAYVIPGSDSQVACLPDDDNCPQGYQCFQSGNVPGFYMCCSGNSLPPKLKSSRLGSALTSAVVSAVSAAKRRAMSSLLANLGAQPPQSLVRYAAAVPKCPSGLLSNGERCLVNQIQACPLGYICIGNDGSRGICCKAAPKCAKKNRKPVFIAPRQVLTCGEEEAACPEGSQCMRSSVPGLEICCMPREGPSIGFVSAKSSSSSSSSSAAVSSSPRHHSYSKSHGRSEAGVPTMVPKCAKDGSLPFFALGSRVPQQCTADRDDECPEEYECEAGSDDNYYCCPAWDRCPSGASPFLVEGSRKPLGCNWMANNCPDGYTCEGSKDRAICCRMRVNQLQCPSGRAPYLYGKRPLACPSGSKRSCPAGYECIASKNGGNQHLCCSTLDNHAPECVSGYAFADPANGKNQICDPALETCPVGYRCKRSTMANTHVCCSVAMDNRYEGYCPAGQIPYTGGGRNAAADEFPIPPTCHMGMNPCPTNGPYQCVYSADKQNSYCCAPLDTAARFKQWPPMSAAAFPPRGANWMQQMYQFQQNAIAPPAVSMGMGCGAGREENVQTGAGEQQQPAQQSQQAMQFGTATFGQQQQTANVAYQQQLYNSMLQQQRQQAEVLSALGNVYAQYGGGEATGVPVVTGDSSSSSIVGNSSPTAQPQQQSSSLFVASCPPWSKPLLDPSTGMGQSCSTWVRCPKGFTCYSNFPDGRNAHCCTTVPLDNQVVFRANTALSDGSAQHQRTQQQLEYSAWPDNNNNSPFAPQYAPARPDRNGSEVGEAVPTKVDAPQLINLTSGEGDGYSKIRWGRCPPNMVNIAGLCKRMFFVGQPGCEMDSQCSMRTNGTRCMKGYCACSAPFLIHESKCVIQCPEGFLNIAGRCHDLTSIVFMDSVDERDNGTIGGFCLPTVVAEEQCMVDNSYCSERTLTCQCRPGYELRIDDLQNRTDKGICMEVEGSRFQGSAANRLLRDHAADEELLEYEASDSEHERPIGNAFFAVEFASDNNNSNATTSTTEITSEGGAAMNGTDTTNSKENSKVRTEEERQGK